VGARFDSDEPEVYEWEVDYGTLATYSFGTDEAAAREHAKPWGRTLRRRLVVRHPWEVVIERKARVRE
jgi:hypothetical protein